MAKGIDQKFVHYGIRKDDLAMIEAICDAESIETIRIYLRRTSAEQQEIVDKVITW